MKAKPIAIETGTSPLRGAQGNRRWVFPAPAPQAPGCGPASGAAQSRRRS